LSLTDGAKREFMVKGWDNLEGLSWSANGRRLFVNTHQSHNAILLSTDLAGNARVLWTQRSGGTIHAVPSPDGRHMAILGELRDQNLWMMENF
jgi:Tol biopolymer transport system component